MPGPSGPVTPPPPPRPVSPPPPGRHAYRIGHGPVQLRRRRRSRIDTVLEAIVATVMVAAVFVLYLVANAHAVDTSNVGWR